MTRGAIGVRISDGINDRTVTRLTSGLKFSKQADGGHKAMSCTVTTPIGTFTDLGVADKAYLYDTRTGQPIWEGYTDAPTPVLGPNGEAYAISALGAMTRAADETRPLVYVDQSLDTYAKSAPSTASSTVETGRWVTDATFTSVRDQLTPGQPLATGSAVGAETSLIQRAAMSLGAIQFYVVSGKTDTGYRTSMYHNTGEVVIGSGMTTTGVGFQLYAGTSFPSATTDIVSLTITRVGGATNVADDVTWTDWVGVILVGQRMTRTGSLLTDAAGMRSAYDVLASEVVEDLLGRLLTFVDKNAATVAVTLRGITQLAYPDGATAQRVLDDLADYEPGCLYEFLHSTPAGHVFNYRPWPLVPRYEISTRDGYTESGADVDLANRIVVTWTDTLGVTQTTVVTVTSAQYPALKALEDAGRVRDAEPVTLPSGLGSLGNAQALGAAILADKAGQPTPATAVVRRPVRDLQTGSMVMPWEIEPGYLVRIRERGVDMRLTAMEYDDDSCSTTLTLGYPSLTRDQRIAQLARA